MKPLHHSKATTSAAPKRPRRTQAERRARSEQRILDATIRRIAERGTVATTLGEVGIAAGYSRGLAAHLFGTKENLLIRAAQAIMTTPRARGLFGIDPEGGFAAFLNAAQEWFPTAAREPERLRALLVLTSEALVRHATKNFRARAAAVAALDRESRRHIRRLLEAGIARGEVRRDIDLDSQALLIVSTLRGMMSQWLVSPASIDLERSGTYWLAELKRSLAPARADSKRRAARVGRRPSRARAASCPPLTAPC
ncbi:MAG: TetR family transcriptional regulator [Candidatus Binatia bacterium]